MTFNDFVSYCITLDNNVRALRTPAMTTTPTSKPAQQSTSTAQGTYAGPIDILAVDVKRNHGPLTQADKDYRCTNGLCLYYGTKRYFTSMCPNKAQKVNATSDTNTTAGPPAVVLYSTTETTTPAKN